MFPQQSDCMKAFERQVTDSTAHKTEQIGCCLMQQFPKSKGKTFEDWELCGRPTGGLSGMYQLPPPKNSCFSPVSHSPVSFSPILSLAQRLKCLFCSAPPRSHEYSGLHFCQ